MLALTRKKGESLVINNDIEITILEIRGDQIKLGVSAPKEVPIYRKEVYTQIQQENRKSAAVWMDIFIVHPESRQFILISDWLCSSH